MATYITYGPITLEGVVIRRIKAEHVMMDDGLQVRYKRWRIEFGAHCNSNQNAASWPARPQNLPVARGGSVQSIYTAETVLWWLTQPRQYFRLEFNDKSFIEVNVPRAGRALDSGFGPKTESMQVSNIAGEMGFDRGNGGAYFMVTGVFVVCESGKDFSNSALQGYSMERSHDVNGDNELTIIKTVIAVYGKPEVIRSLEAGGQQSVWTAFGELGALLSEVPVGFKRHSARIQVKPNATEAIVSFQDDEQMTPLGSQSPASFFEASQVDTWRMGEGKNEGSPMCMRIVQVAAIAPKNDTRERIIRQMLYWLTIKGMGGDEGRHGGAGASARFLRYAEVTMSVNYSTNMLNLVAKIMMNPAPSGPAGIPYSLVQNRMTANEDYGDIDLAMNDSRANGDEALQGTERGQALSPALNYYGTAGSYLADVLVDKITLGNPQNARQIPDGNAFICGQGSGSGNTAYSTGSGTYPYPYNETFVQVNITDTFDMDYSYLGMILPDNIGYESTWMQTKYETKKGTMVVPTAGFMPGGSGDPTDIPLRVQFTVHEGQQRKVVTWGVQAISQYPPDYPDANTLNDNDILIKSVVKPAACVPAADGVYAWTITGTYYYDCLELVEPGDTLGVGKLPISPGDPSDYRYSSGKAASGQLPLE